MPSDFFSERDPEPEVLTAEPSAAWLRIPSDPFRSLPIPSDPFRSLPIPSGPFGQVLTAEQWAAGGSGLYGFGGGDVRAKDKAKDKAKDEAKDEAPAAADATAAASAEGKKEN